MKKKVSEKSGFIISTSLILLLSVIYVMLIKVGVKKQNIDLKKCDEISAVVQNLGIDFRIDSKQRRAEVFFIKLADLEKKLGVYRMSSNYNDLINKINIGDTLKVYYKDNINKSENANIDLIQIEKGDKILLAKDEYEKKESSLIYIGVGGIIANIILFIFSRKKYLTIAKASANSRHD